MIEAERRFAGRVPYATYRTFDVERAPSAQGIAAGTYDIVLANNVLHATRDIVKQSRTPGRCWRPAACSCSTRWPRTTCSGT